MSLKKPTYTDENHRVVQETWSDGKLVSKEISDFGDIDEHGYHELIQYDNEGKTKFRQLKEPTRHGSHRLEEHYNKGFMTSQTEKIEENPYIIKHRFFYPQVMPDGTKLEKEILRREEIINCSSGKSEVKEFSLDGQEMTPEPKKKTPLINWWKIKDR